MTTRTAPSRGEGASGTTANAIFLRRRRRYAVAAGTRPPANAAVASLQRELEALGHVMSVDLMLAVATLGNEELRDFRKGLIADLCALTGAGRAPRPMYPNFPDEVMAADEAELYLNAMIHYLTGLVPSDLPELGLVGSGPEKARPALTEKTKLAVIELGTEDEFRSIFRNMLAGKGSLSETDREDLTWFVQNRTNELHLIVPDAIPAKETLAIFTALVAGSGDVAYPLMRSHYKTVTDALRLAVAMSGGDVSLAAPTRFRSFRRPERRLLLALMDQAGEAMRSDMQRRPEVFKRLGERLHPMEPKMARDFPRVAAAYQSLRAGDPYPTAMTAVEEALRRGDVIGAIATLEKRPGDYARRLDHLLRLSTGREPVVIERFAAVASGVSSPVLLQALAHFKHRCEARPRRTFFPKGQVAKAWTQDNDLQELDPGVTRAVVNVIEDALMARFAKLAPLGRVYISPEMKNFVVPLAQRTASKALRTIARGSSLPMPEGGTIRFFLWWSEGDVGGKPSGRVDVDLSAVTYGEDFKFIDHVTYYNLRSSKFRAVHSGDITSAPKGASEYIDLDIDSFLKGGARYVVMSVNSFSKHAFKDLPECSAGWMARAEPGSGEIYEPRTVMTKVDLAGDTTIAVPLILDLQERRVLWADLALKSRPRPNNVDGNKFGLVQLGRAMAALRLPNLYDLLHLHVRARGGHLVDDPAAAEHIYAPDAGTTPHDTDEILAHYL